MPRQREPQIPPVPTPRATAKTGALAHHAAVFSAFVKAAGRTLISGLTHTPAERQMAALPAGRMRVWGRNVRLHLEADIVLVMDDLVADIQVDDAQLPLIPEKTDQYTFHILAGRLRLGFESIEWLLGRYLFPAANVPLRNPRVALDERGIRLEAILGLGPLAIPLTIGGPLGLAKNGLVELQASRIAAGSIGVNQILKLLQTDLAHVFRLEPGAAIVASGNTLLLDPEQIIPVPRARGRPVALATVPGELVLTYASPEAIEAPPLLTRDAKAYLFCLGHALLVGKMFLHDAVLQMVARDETRGLLDVSLGAYRKQLAAGESTLSQRGELLVRLPNLDQVDEPYRKINGRLMPDKHRSPFRTRQPK